MTTDEANTQRRVAIYNDFVASLPAGDAERYRRMENRFVTYMHHRNQRFSPQGFAEMMVAIAEKVSFSERME